MDYTIFIVLGICLGTIGILLLIRYLINKNIITESELESGLNITKDILKLSTILIQELNIKNIDKDRVILITTMITDGFTRAIEIIKIKDIDALKIYVEDFTYDKCKELNVEVNDNVKIIVEMIVKYLLENEYLKKITDGK